MSDALTDRRGVAPALLVSMPQLADPNFHQSVILLCEHDPQGAFGLVLNRRTLTLASSVVRLTPPVETDNGLELWIGGPVEPERGWILTGAEPDDDEGMSTFVDISGFPSARARTALTDTHTIAHRVRRLECGAT